MSEEISNENCSHDCSSCAAAGGCAGNQPESLLKEQNKASNVKKVIGIVSGKGGVGKSSITGMLSVLFRRRDYKTAVLDADITGPSIPKLFQLTDRITGDENGMNPALTTTGIKVMSVNLLLEDETSPVVWRGPVIAGTVTQFWTDTNWGDIDYMFVDMPPGTGDVPLTVFQSLPLDGIIIVTSPQELVSMIVQKAVNMAQMMGIPVLGIVENYSYVKCPDCGREHQIFGESKIEQTAEKYGIDVLAKLPLDPKLASLCDRGMLELMEFDLLDHAVEMIEEKTK